MRDVVKIETDLKMPYRFRWSDRVGLRFEFPMPSDYRYSRYWFKNLLRLPRQWRQQIECFIQRGLYGYSYYDWWSLDAYLCSWLPSAIRKYRHSAGVPGEMEPEAWYEVIESMARGFEAHHELVDGFVIPGSDRYGELHRIRVAGFDAFRDWFGALWD